MSQRSCVLVFAGLDPSGGAGISADIEAIGAMGAHALPIITALTVQDNDRVYAVNPVDAEIIRHQALMLSRKIPIAAVKIGIVGNKLNAEAIAEVIRHLRKRQTELPVVLDTVLASGLGDPVSDDQPEDVIFPLLGLATLVMPNLPEAARLCGDEHPPEIQAQRLMGFGAKHVLIKGGHGAIEHDVVNRWFTQGEKHEWTWQRLPGAFHGSGCTLASAIAARLAQRKPMREALTEAQQYAHQTLESSYPIAPGQRIPNRRVDLPK
jgi:hydroxymethylpyrimidine/phosphomethylpyrimidine kinase